MTPSKWLLSGCLFLFAGVAAKSSVQSQIPVGPAPLCAVTSAEFATWKVGSNFAPPDSASFDPSSDCAFYKWSSQMFLWLTTKDVRGNLLMFSPKFDNAVEDTSTGAFQLVNSTGLDAQNKTNVSFRVRVNKPKVLLLKSAGSTNNVVGGPAGDTGSTGQAGGGVLIVNGKPIPVSGKTGLSTYPVVYYAIQENDVFTALKEHWRKVPYYNAGPNKTNFPITLDQAKEIQKASGKTLPNLSQLAIEVKTAWIDTAYITPAQASSLIQIKSDVPAFTQALNAKNQLVLSWDGTTMVTRTLAMVGMHVVGSVNHHPEMVWATFESNFNSPDATYSYLNQNYDPTTKACKTGTTCLNTVTFSTTSSQSSIFYNGPKGASTAPDVIVETASSGDDSSIVAAGKTLTATSVARLNPWGSQQPATPSLSDPAVLNNTLLVSLMNSLQPKLAASGGTGKALANYFLVGAIWSNRIIPPQPGYQLIGSQFAANTTMETFQQVRPGNPDPNATANNCFSCHGDFDGTQGTSVSHVFPNTVVFR
ncbi:hypothetical protein NDN01_05660 [Sphingomonas sp. QA11]|uniref:hypothetical protein n=1 Tax=Sphingomonas sp. QA11 TaxID=2950605 RepID=UPI0023493E37|nr:hypothetical protein [Sphingomonas sp. QA11]WCM28410.1 hypothetical protein NDN01_05660 [Sphingomonas sp. QA11]